MKTYAIVLGGGSGARMGTELNKVLIPIRGVPAIVRAIAPFTGLCDGVIVVARTEEMPLMASLLRRYGLGKAVLSLVQGGADRQESVWNGLEALPQDAGIVLIHDGARVLVTEAVIRDAMQSAKTRGSGIPSLPVTDTVKRTDAEGAVVETLDRDALRTIQTPQAFRVADIRRAHENAAKTGYRGTDDAALLEHAGMPVYVTQGSRDNLKLTTPLDLRLAEALLTLREQEENG